MRTVARIAAVLLLLWGVPISMVGVAMMRDSDLETREAGLPALMIFGMPPVAMGLGLLVWSRNGKLVGQSNRLKRSFFRLIQESDGKITVLRFAMETGLEGDEAKAYLDERAIEFNATFEATSQGAVAYVFDLGQPELPDSLPGQSLPEAQAES